MTRTVLRALYLLIMTTTQHPAPTYALARNLPGCARTTTVRVRLTGTTTPTGRMRVVAADVRYYNIGQGYAVRPDQLTPCD